MKVKELCQDFDPKAWGNLERHNPRSPHLPTADEIIVANVKTEKNTLRLSLYNDSTVLLFSLPNDKSAERVCAVLRAYLTLDGPLSLRQLGEINL